MTLLCFAISGVQGCVLFPSTVVQCHFLPVLFAVWLLDVISVRLLLSLCLSRFYYFSPELLWQPQNCLLWRFVLELCWVPPMVPQDLKITLLVWHSRPLQSKTWWHMPVTPKLKRLKQEGCHEFEASLCYVASIRPAWTMQQVSGQPGSTLDKQILPGPLAFYLSRLRILWSMILPSLLSPAIRLFLTQLSLRIPSVFSPVKVP